MTQLCYTCPSCNTSCAAEEDESGKTIFFDGYADFYVICPSCGKRLRVEVTVWEEDMAK